MKYRLHRSADSKILGGICIGLAESFETDVTLIRIIVFLLCVFQPFMTVVYLVLIALLPIGKGPVLEKYKSAHPDTSSNDKVDDELNSKDNAKQPDSFSEARYKKTYTRPTENKYTYKDHKEPVKQKQDTFTSDENNEEQTKPQSSFAIILFGVLMICTGIGIVIARYVFGYDIALNEMINYVLLSLGLFFIINGISDVATKKGGSRILKIVFGSIILYISLSRIITIGSFAYITSDYLLYAIRYMWPIIILATVVTLLLPNRKRGAKIWLLILLIVFIAAIVLRVAA